MTAPGAAASTAGRWLDMAARRLAAAGVDRGRAEARTLLAQALACDPAVLFARPETPLPAAAADVADGLLARRLAGEPMGRIIGRREFWSLEFQLGPDVLEPRPDTECLVAVALECLDPQAPARVLDLGVGSGCILLALLSERTRATGIGVDRSIGAAAVARANGAAHGLAARAAFIVGDWAAALDDRSFDLIVSNPPYVAEAERSGCRPDAATLGFDPPLALWAGADGLDAYRAILPELPRLLTRDGAAVLEIGADQACAVAALANAAGLRVSEKRRDLGGHIRCLKLERLKNRGPGVE